MMQEFYRATVLVGALAIATLSGCATTRYAVRVERDDWARAQCQEVIDELNAQSVPPRRVASGPSVTFPRNYHPRCWSTCHTSLALENGENSPTQAYTSLDALANARRGDE